MYNTNGLDFWEIVAASWMFSWGVLSICTVGAVALSWWVFGEKKAEKVPHVAPAKAEPAGATHVAHA